MKKLAALIIMIAIAFVANAQIGGLSTGYINPFSATCIDPNTVEFEPSFSISGYNSEFGNDGKSSKLDTLQFENELGFRFTYGVAKRLEMGMFVPSNMSYLNYGLKLNLINHDKFQFATIGGVNFDFSTQDFIQQIAGGVAANYSFCDNINSVFNAQYCNNLTNSSSFHLYLDNAYDFENFSLILGVYYDNYNEAGQMSDNLSLSPAIMFIGDNFYVSFYFPVSVYGHNDYSYKNFGFALTLPIK